MKIVLISTYELGRQPFGVVSPAAWLRRAGHEVACLDLTRESLDEGTVRAAELIGIYLPMHTATRLAAKLIPTLRELNAGAHLCCYGLYAPMNAEYLRGLGVGTILGGEFEAELVKLAGRVQGLKPLPASGEMSDLKVRPTKQDEMPDRQDEMVERELHSIKLADVNESHQSTSCRDGAQRAAPLHDRADVAIAHDGESREREAQVEKEISLERLEFLVPDRGGMPGIEKYAHLVLPDGSHRVVGSTEASRGCKHLCRHCPIVPVYDGVFRIVQRDVVMADVRQQVEAGARHISFGDPDFFNGILHAKELMKEFHREFPDVTYDVTIKIEHLRKHEKELAALRESGCLFVISAVEAVDDGILARLDKGHTRGDFVYVARKFRELGMTLHPTFVAFTPWTTLDGYLDLLQVIVAEELVENVAPVQLGIRLLIPEGSRLLELSETRELVGAFDAESLVYPWRHTDARVDRLSEAVQAIAADADAKKMSRPEAFARIWRAAHAAAGVDVPELKLGAGRAVPFLSEPWYCCAEPTKEQLVSIGAVASRKAEPAIGGERGGFPADGFV
jgi:radical SAM superfamily enzyme YgiQ (UPF0313 family)